MASENILVVEDESITALDIQQSLRSKGFAVPDIACTGPEAIALARQNQPDLVLMDIRLKGGMDGIQAATEIRKERNVPVVFLTAYVDRSTLQRAKSAEPFAYLLKPFEEAVLSTTIEIALNKHRAHELLIRQSAEALHLSEERFSRLAENAADYAIVLLDAAGHILTWNPGAERMHGWCAGEVLGKPVSMLYSDGASERSAEQDLQAAAQAGRLAAYGRQARKDHSRFSAELILVALRNTAGGLAGFLKVTREVAPGGAHN